MARLTTICWHHFEKHESMMKVLYWGRSLLVHFGNVKLRRKIPEESPNQKVSARGAGLDFRQISGTAELRQSLFGKLAKNARDFRN